ncbi:hypothetical protein CDV55_100536 [Aspergillus turcosus]|uniref:Uncharacterized protein n=1 Tax=Aspergillus turcosus TaxID=1245748 RepID=A0A229WS96_9EURO|nr:hypothetical protein CDV55_100536 [Aspergillus turcosus]RLL92986.1 hypothetical protein CFD26_100570 [Aspergillus turcosus]
MEADLLSPGASVLTWLSSSEEELPPSPDEEIRATRKIDNYEATRPDDLTKQILEAFKEHLPWQGKQALVHFIAGADDGKLMQLAYHLYTAILLPVQAQSQHAITSPFVDSQDCEGDVYQTMLESASRNDQGRLKQLCLQRDNWRCMLTGTLDISQAKDLRTAAASTRLAHILPFSIGKWNDNVSEHRISQIWATLHRLFPDVTICPSDVNHSSNLMTLIVPFEIALGNFSLALQPTGQKKEYEILTFPGFETAYNALLPRPNENGARIVKFRSHTELPLPSPAILRAHASITKILKSNEIFERIQKILQMPETTRHLSTDGATDLDFLFWKL